MRNDGDEDAIDRKEEEEEERLIEKVDFLQGKTEKKDQSDI